MDARRDRETIPNFAPQYLARGVAKQVLSVIICRSGVRKYAPVRLLLKLTTGDSQNSCHLYGNDDGPMKDHDSQLTVCCQAKRVLV
jgi:hypothetical protein